MRASRDYLADLVRLGRLHDEEQRRSAWRQGMATLATALTGRQQVPLEGLPPEALLSSVRVALDSRLIDDLGFLSPPAAAAALYELAVAVPMGAERRDLGRRVLTLLHQGDASTFVALATRIALGSHRALSGAAARARVALCLDLPIGAGAQADALALALITRRDAERHWLTLPSTGSLPSRRLAARLLERAAREAARRAAQMDDSGARVFQIESVRAAWDRLLADREPLVWRHVATARGLLSVALPDLGDEIRRELRPELSPTEWRRAAASLAATIALTPDASVEEAGAVLGTEILGRDRGVAGAMMLGLPRAAETEPEAVEALLNTLVQEGGLDATEALVSLRRERLGGEIGAWACELARAQLRESIDGTTTSDDGRIALLEALFDELGTEEERDGITLPEQIASCLVSYAEHGALRAYAEAEVLLADVAGTVDALHHIGDNPTGRQHAFRALRELDVALLETATLSDLLMLGATDDTENPAATLSEIFGSLTDFLMSKERAPIVEPQVDHFTLRLHRMRTMLHLVDAEGSYDSEGGTTLRERRLDSANMLLARVTQDQQTPLRRVVCAAAARACDGLVRDDIAEVSDVLITVGRATREAGDLSVFAEASMLPDIDAPMRAYADLAKVIATASMDGLGERACLDGLLRFAHALPVASSPRVEALRALLRRLVGAAEDIAAVGSLAELTSGPEGSRLGPLEDVARSLARLVAGAERRLGRHADDDAPRIGAAIRLVDFCAERALRGAREALQDAIASAGEALCAELPALVAEAILPTLHRLVTLPVDAPLEPRASFVPVALVESPLPPWLPPSRMLGGFYVLRALSAGAVGSVFVARRAEERHDTTAERFALKVPEYDGAAARTLSEAQFLQLFREEAGALLSLPTHGNIARFVTFDAGAHPKPILVMELVEGPTVERVIQLGHMDVDGALDILSGVAAGLEAMHAAGIGHLDIKPSNVILRSKNGSDSVAPVLVDFGLAGRHLRPGCATGEYGAPEIWRAVGDGHAPGPMAADVYAFACIAYELLTGQTLFDAPTEMALIAGHLAHDGDPPGVLALGSDPVTEPLAHILRHALRRDPTTRATMGQVCKWLEDLRGRLAAQDWPLPV